MNILIVDDDKVFGLQLESMLAELQYQIVGRAATFQQAINYINTNHVDLVIVDIVLDGIRGGIDLAKELSLLKIPFVFTTAYDSNEFYEQALVFNDFHYIVKPFHIHTLDSIIRIISHKNEQSLQYIKITSRGQAIPANEVLFIEVEGTYTFIQTINKRYVFKKSLNLLKKSLPLSNFIQIHRSFLVQKKFIKRINFDKNIVELENYTLPMSRRMKRELLNNKI